MNVTLNYNKLNYNIEVTKSTPLSFLYKLSEKQFDIPLENIDLIYEEKSIPNSSKSSGEYFLSSESNINILVEDKSKKPNMKIQNNPKKKLKLKSKSKTKLKPLPKIIKKKPKKHYVRCQICKKKDAYFYCRKCNEFFCVDCNIKFPSHNKHELLDLEEGDIHHSFDLYRKLIIDNCNIIQNAYLSSNEWIINDEMRNEYFQNLIELIKDIGEKSQDLNYINSNYYVNNDLIIEVKEELFDIKPPSFKDEAIEIFGFINEKEKILLNYMSFVNLQVIKSEYNKKMMELFENAQKYLTDLYQEITKKIDEANKLNDYGIKELKEYNDKMSNNIIDEENSNNLGNKTINFNNQRNNKRNILYDNKKISDFVERMGFFSFDSKEDSFNKNNDLKFNTITIRDFYKKPNNYINIKSKILLTDSPRNVSISNNEIPLISPTSISKIQNNTTNGFPTSPIKFQNNNLKLKKLLNSNRNSLFKNNQLVSVEKINHILENPVKNKKKKSSTNFFDK